MRRAALVCVSAVALVPAAGAQQPLPGGRALVAKASVSPTTHLFGDSVVARIDLVVDPREFDPDGLRVQLRFAPYEAAGGVRVQRRTSGGLVHVRYEATLRCLHVACIAPRFQSALGAQEEGRAERHTIVLPPAEIVYREPAGRDALLLVEHLPAIQVVSRINTAQASSLDPAARPGTQGTFVASLEPPAPTYRVPPTVLAGAAFAAAALLALLPAALLWRLLRARWVAARRGRPLTPLERALTLIEWSGRRDDADEDRRKALETLAVVLERGDEPALAAATRRAAWALVAPPPQRAGELGAEARRALEGGAHARRA